MNDDQKVWYVEPDPVEARLDTLVTALLHFAGAVAAVIVIAATAGYAYTLWLA